MLFYFAFYSSYKFQFLINYWWPAVLKWVNIDSLSKYWRIKSSPNFWRSSIRTLLFIASQFSDLVKNGLIVNWKVPARFKYIVDISCIQKVTNTNIEFLSLLSSLYSCVHLFFSKVILSLSEFEYERRFFSLLVTTIQHASLALKNSWNARVFLISCGTDALSL